MDVDDTCELRPILISGIRYSERGWKWIPRLHLHCGQEVCDHLQDICVALRGVVESRRIDESHLPLVECKFIRELNLGRA
jgi:hypothetical protein